MLRCNDESIGKLLHSFELGLLTPEENKQFEAHLVVCDACFEKVRAFEPYAKALRSSQSARESVSLFSKPETGLDRSGPWRWLRPVRPSLIQLALALMVILALLYPAYLGIVGLKTSKVRRLQAVQLVPERSGGVGAVIESDLVLTFVFEGAVPSQGYEIRLDDQSGRTLYIDDSFTGFDAYGTGFLFLPEVVLQTSRYRLIIIDRSGGSSGDTAVYEFELTKPSRED